MNITAEMVKAAARRWTAASARLEGRGLPDGYVRPARVEAFLAARRSRLESGRLKSA